MNRKELAQNLRDLLPEKTKLPEALFTDISDDLVFECWNRCDGCGDAVLSEEALNHAIEEAQRTHDFIMAVQAHTHDDEDDVDLEQFRQKLPSYIITVCTYVSRERAQEIVQKVDKEIELYGEDREEEEFEPDRFTVTVVRTKDDCTVQSFEYLIASEEDNEALFHDTIDKALEEHPDCAVVSMGPEPLEPCSCGSCDGFLTTYLTSADYIRTKLLDQDD